MARSKHERWLEPDGLLLIQGWARDGLSEQQIAHNMGISIRTLAYYKNRYMHIMQALKKGKEVVDFAVENALFKKALAGDTIAMIFWLKNRKPHKWRDRHDMHVDEISIQKVNTLMEGLDDEASCRTDE